MKNHYELIGVARTATAAEIKTRYRALSKLYHPDAGGTEQQMAQLNTAYRVLISPLERDAYDRKLTREREAAQAATAHRQRAARTTHAETAAKHEAARAYAEQTFAAAKPTTTKKSAFWKYMAWSTAAYVVFGLAIIYVLTMPSTASPDATAETTSSTSLAQEAANASASIPETPASAHVSQTSDPAAAQTSSSEGPATETQNLPEKTQDDATNDTQDACDTSDHCDSAANQSQPTKKRHEWRQLFPF